MELKEFISETIKQITDGVLEGNEYLEEKSVGGVIGDKLTTVNFDIAVSATEQKTKDAHGKLKIIQVFETGASAANNIEKLNQNRINFKITLQINTKIKSFSIS